MVMDIQSIQAFIEVSDSGSFSRAADALFLTQPAISKRIQSLEQALDVKLFDRIGKRVQLTEAGLALLPGFRRILDEIDESQRIISNLRGAPSGVLSLATSHHIGLHRLPPVLRRFADQYPAVDLQLQFMDSEQACEQVLRGDTELAIVTLPFAADPRLVLQRVWHDPMHCVVASDHPLAGVGRLTLKQLMKQPAVLPSSNTFTRRLIDKALGLDDETSILLETNYMETIKVMVATGLGWGVVPDSMLDESLSVIELSGVRMARELGAVFHNARTRSSAANAMMEQLRRD
jgi:DNA-binding transcriptional LysR family regulator